MFLFFPWAKIKGGGTLYMTGRSQSLRPGRLGSTASPDIRGFTITELVIATAIMGILALAVASMVNNQMRAQASLDSRVAFAGYVQQLQLLAQTGNCTSLFNTSRSLASDIQFNRPPITQLPEQVPPSTGSASGPSSSYLTVGPYPNFLLQSINLSNIHPTGGDPNIYVADLVLSGTTRIRPNQRDSVAGSMLSASIPLVIVGNNGLFSGCGPSSVAAQVGGTINVTGGGQSSPFPEVTSWAPKGVPWFMQSTVGSNSGLPNCPQSLLSVAPSGSSCVSPSSYFPGRYLVNTFSPIQPSAPTSPSRAQ